MFKTYLYRLLLDPDPANTDGGGNPAPEPVAPAAVVPDPAPTPEPAAPAVDDIYSAEALAQDAQRFGKMFGVVPGAKKIDPPAPAPIVAPVVPVAPVVSPAPPAPVRGPGTRDLSFLPPEHHKAAREMSAPAFALFQQRWTEAERLRTEHATAVQAKTALETELSAHKGFYDHPDAYRVTPEYTQATTELSNAEYALDHLNAQLIAVNQNKKWRPLMEYTDPTTKQVSLRPGELQDPSAEAVAMLTNQLGYARMQQYQANQKVTQLPQQFQQQRAQFTTGLTATVDKLVKPLYTALEAQAKPIADMLRSQMPVLYRRSEMSEPLIMALATMHAMARNQMAAAPAAPAAALQSEAARSGAITTATAAPGGGSSDNKDIYDGVTDDQFLRYSRFGTTYAPATK